MASLMFFMSSMSLRWPRPSLMRVRYVSSLRPPMRQGAHLPQDSSTVKSR